MDGLPVPCKGVEQREGGGAVDVHILLRACCGEQRAAGRERHAGDTFCRGVVVRDGYVQRS